MNRDAFTLPQWKIEAACNFALIFKDVCKESDDKSHLQVMRGHICNRSIMLFINAVFALYQFYSTPDSESINIHDVIY